MPQGYDGSIRINTQIDQSGIKSGVNNIEKSVGGLQSSLKSLAGTVATAFGVHQIINFGKQAIQLASDLTEVQNVVETSFGSMSAQVDEWAKNSIQQFGMSELSAKQMASTYMSMSVGSGLNGQGAADMAMKTAERAADIASFYNKSLEESDTMLKSIWTGETESLKQIGVVMTQTNLDAYALANGFGKTTSEMTQSEQIMLRYQYVMNQTRLAAGDFVKTQDSWANQTRILSEQWNQFLSIMGGALIQILTPALQFLNQFMSILIQWAQTFAAVISAIFGQESAVSSAQQTTAAAASSAGAAASSQEDYASSLDDTADSAKAAAKEIKNLSGLDEINRYSVASTSSGGSGGGGSGGGISAPEYTIPDPINYDSLAQGMNDKFKKIWDSVVKGFNDWFVVPFQKNLKKLDKPIENFKKLFKDIGDQCVIWLEPLSDWFATDLKGNVESAISLATTYLGNFMLVASVVATTLWNTLKPVIDWIIREGLPMLSEAFDEAAFTMEEWSNTVTEIILIIWHDVFERAFSFISQVVTDTFGIIKTLWDKYGATTFANVRETINTTKELFLQAWEFIKPIFDRIFEVLTQLWENHLAPLVENIGTFVAKLVNGAMEIYNGFIAPVVSWFIDTFGPIISAVFSNIVTGIGAVFGSFIDFKNGIFTTLGGIIDFIVGVFTGDWDRAWQGIQDIFSGIWNSFVGIVRIPANGIITLINNLISAMNTMIGGLNQIQFDVPDWVPFIGGEHFGINIPKIPTIPYLAQGAVIPPNQHFLAVLGDQKRGTNVEAPLDTIKQALAEVMAERGGGTGNTYTVNAQVGRKTLFQLMIDEAKMSQMRTGKNPFELA